MITIDKVYIKWENNNDPDLSWLGTYSNYPIAPYVDRQKRGVMNRHEYRYFNGANAESLEQDFQRIEAYSKGEWTMLGCKAIAEVSYPLDSIGSRRIQRFESAGIWGIESDCGELTKAEVEGEQLADLAEHLGKFGITVNAGELKELL